MIELRTPGELDAMRAAGAVVADMHAAVRALAAPGVRLTQLDAVARDVLADAGATSLTAELGRDVPVAEAIEPVEAAMRRVLTGTAVPA